MSDNSLDMDENLEALLAYLLGWVTGIIFYVLEDESKFVRFHAMQSILTFLPIHIIVVIIGTGFGYYFGFFGMIAQIIGIIAFALWLILMLKAYKGEWFKLPYIGDYAEDFVD